MNDLTKFVVCHLVHAWTIIVIRRYEAAIMPIAVVIFPLSAKATVSSVCALLGVSYLPLSQEGNKHKRLSKTISAYPQDR